MLERKRTQQAKYRRPFDRAANLPARASAKDRAETRNIRHALKPSWSAVKGGEMSEESTPPKRAGTEHSNGRPQGVAPTCNDHIRVGDGLVHQADGHHRHNDRIRVGDGPCAVPNSHQNTKLFQCVQRPKNLYLLKNTRRSAPSFPLLFSHKPIIYHIAPETYCERPSYDLPGKPAHNLRLHHHCASIHLMDKSQSIQSDHQNNIRHHGSGSRTHSPSVARHGRAGHLALYRPRHHLVHHIPDLERSHICLLSHSRGRDTSHTSQLTKGPNLSAERQSPTSRILIPILLTGLSGLPPCPLTCFCPPCRQWCGNFKPNPPTSSPPSPSS